MLTPRPVPSRSAPSRHNLLGTSWLQSTTSVDVEIRQGAGIGDGREAEAIIGGARRVSAESIPSVVFVTPRARALRAPPRLRWPLGERVRKGDL